MALEGATAGFGARGLGGSAGTDEMTDAVMMP